MNRSKRSYKIILLLFSIAALWISIGSLVHFHQYKIYGHSLLSEVVISKREQELPGMQDDGGMIASDGIIPGTLADDRSSGLAPTRISFLFSPGLTGLFTGNPPSLRAPPAC